jgi:hypothetical protein
MKCKWSWIGSTVDSLSETITSRQQWDYSQSARRWSILGKNYIYRKIVFQNQRINGDNFWIIKSELFTNGLTPQEILKGILQAKDIPCSWIRRLTWLNCSADST